MNRIKYILLILFLFLYNGICMAQSNATLPFSKTKLLFSDDFKSNLDNLICFDYYPYLKVFLAVEELKYIRQYVH